MALSDKEKALDTIAKQIKQLDGNKLSLDVLNCDGDLFHARANLFNIISSHGYSLDKNYKPVKNK